MWRIIIPQPDHSVKLTRPAQEFTYIVKHSYDVLEASRAPILRGWTDTEMEVAMPHPEDPNYGGFTIVPIITCTAEMRFLSKVVIVDRDGGRRTFGTLASHASHNAAWEHAIGHAKGWIDRSDS